MTGAETTVIKGGAMLASGGLMAELIIFNDPLYGTLALSGAVVSSFGVIHEITENRENHTIYTIIGEMLKGLTLGFIAIPFWFLLLSGIGNETIAKYLEIESALKVEKSLWLIVSFVLAWYTIPIMNFIVDSSKLLGNKIKRMFKK